MTVTLNEVNLQAFLHDPAGGIARFTQYTVVPEIREICRNYCSRPWPGGGRGARFPPPGPPYLRTGDLVASLEVVSSPGPGGIEYDIVTNATHRGWNYGQILKSRGYRFMPDEFYL